MAVEILWTSSVAKDLYVREVGNITTGPILGVMSSDTLDVTNFDNTNYRDDFFDPRSLNSNLIIELNNNLAASDYVTKSTETGTITKGAISSPPPDVNSTTDAVLHIPPRHEEKTRTLIRFWSGASGTGNCLYSCWADEFISSSLAPYSFI